MSSPLRDFLEIPYDQLEELNLTAKARRLARVSPDEAREVIEMSLAQMERRNPTVELQRTRSKSSVEHK